MTRLSTQRMIQKLTRDLEWPVLERVSELPVVRMVSDPKNRSHIVYLPDPAKAQGTAMDHLHELGHATLCERVDPLFASSGRFPVFAPKKQFIPLIPAVNVASDWFVCHWQQEQLPTRMNRIIKKGLPVVEQILAAEELPPVVVILSSAMLIAQAIRYLAAPIECEGILASLVQAFLSVPPERPSAEQLLQLVNKIMACYTELRAGLAEEDGVLVWQIGR